MDLEKNSKQLGKIEAMRNLDDDIKLFIFHNDDVYSIIKVDFSTVLPKSKLIYQTNEYYDALIKFWEK